MEQRNHQRIICLLLLAVSTLIHGQTTDGPWVDFSAEEWTRVENSVDRGLHWLSQQQASNGAIGISSAGAQPAHTALATMAFLSRGHQPGQGPYGRALERAIDYVVACQDRYGFFVLDRSYKSSGSSYSHAIAGVMLAEVIGKTDQNRNERIAHALRRGLEATVKLQQRHYNDPRDRGGWRYILRREGADADLSVSTWHMLFLRAAKNANFNVPESLVVDASAFVHRCYDSSAGKFGYLPGRSGTISMTGAGTLCLFLAGKYDDPAALAGIKTLQNYNFSNLFSSNWPYYTCYHSSQAGSQAGGQARNDILRGITSFLLGQQTADGSWPKKGGSQLTGKTYTTSLAVLSLTPSWQILPIYQQ